MKAIYCSSTCIFLSLHGIDVIGAIGGPPAIHVGRRYQSLGVPPSTGASGEIRVIADFLTALKCYELLNSHQNIQKDLQKLLASWRSDTWTWFNEFHIDLSIYQVRLSYLSFSVACTRLYTLVCRSVRPKYF